jgi:hypothetical protein
MCKEVHLEQEEELIRKEVSLEHKKALICTEASLKQEKEKYLRKYLWKRRMY